MSISEDVVIGIKHQQHFEHLVLEEDFCPALITMRNITRLVTQVPGWVMAAVCCFSCSQDTLHMKPARLSPSGWASRAARPAARTSVPQGFTPLCSVRSRRFVTCCSKQLLDHHTSSWATRDILNWEGM